MIKETYTSLPTYLSARYEEEQNQYYIQESEKIVSETATKFRQAVKDGKNLSELFYTTLEELGEARYQIALANKTDNVEFFGKRRDQILSEGEIPFSFTPLYKPYETYNVSLLEKIQKHLSKMKHTKKEFIQTELCINYEPCLGRASRIEIKIMNEKSNNKILTLPEFENCLRLSPLCGLPPPQDQKGVLPFLDNLLKNESALKELRKNSLDDYLLLKIHKIIANIRKIEKWKELKKSDWVLVTVRSEIDNKLYALSYYLTWIYRDFKSDPVKYMTERSGITILHHDKFLIETTLKDVASLFVKALTCNEDKFDDLKDTMTLLSYEWSHIMPKRRGNSGEGEWIERALYAAKGYSLKYANSKLLNLEALTSSLPEFAKNYNALTCIEKTINNQ
jgi:hypothetical protein